MESHNPFSIACDVKWSLFVSVHFFTAATMGPLNCDKLTAPKNGAVDLSQGMMSGSMAMYSCDEGYVLSGIAERICDLNKNGDWSGTQPTCLRE